MPSSRGVLLKMCLFNLQKLSIPYNFLKIEQTQSKQNPWELSLNELSFNKNAVLQHATLLSHEK